MSDSLTPPLLGLDAETMRDLGYQAVDALVEHYTTINQKSVVPGKLDQDCLPESLTSFPKDKQDPGQVLSASLESVLSNTMKIIHPRFYAYIPGPSNYVSAIADFMSSGFNVFAGTAPENMGCYEVEQNTVRWLCDLAGMDEKAGGLFVSGGSVASLTGLAAARHIKLNDHTDKTTIYFSAETHSSVERALFILGFKKEQYRIIPVDKEFRIDMTALRAEISKDRQAGLQPFCIIGNAGTTNTGAVDPLDQLAAICEQESIWFHIDAAYGGGGLLSTTERHRFNGIESADSIALDPHKWLFQPYECGCTLVKDPTWLRDTFRRLPDYMRDSDDQKTMNFRDMSPQVTRSFKAFKLWLSLQVFGIETFAQAVEEGLALARFTQSYLEEREHWEIISPATLGIVAFRYVVDGYSNDALDDLNAEIIQRINDDGFAYFSSTILNGQKVNRIAPLHPALTEDDITETVIRLEEIARQLI